jgi:FtsP/CotA-like multicopper oxidase with cupredoxin domain
MSSNATVLAAAALAVVAAVPAVAVARGNHRGAAVTSHKAHTAAPAAKESSAGVSLGEMFVKPSLTSLGAGRIVFQVKNDGAVPHALAVDGYAERTGDLAAGATGTVTLDDVPEGTTLTLFCPVPGHREAGMRATVTVGHDTSGMAGMPGMTTAPGAPIDFNAMDSAMRERTKMFPAKTAGVGAQPLAPKVLADGTKEFTLVAKIVKWEVEPGRTVDAWTYNGTVPGPTIKVDVGDKVKVVLRNDLPESTALHFHGVRVPISQDGVPDITQEPVKPHGTFTYAFTATRPAVGMYHSHHDAVKQVPNGLAGTFLVGEMPVPKGVRVSQELPMVLDDSGVIGFALNGKSFPATAPIVAKRGEWVEVHYLNEGAAIHPMHLHGLDQLVVAKDGFPVPQPYYADTVLVAPGERYTVLVKAELPGTWAWHCHILSHAENEQGMFGMVTAIVVT